MALGSSRPRGRSLVSLQTRISVVARRVQEDARTEHREASTARKEAARAQAEVLKRIRREGMKDKHNILPIHFMAFPELVSYEKYLRNKDRENRRKQINKRKRRQRGRKR